MAAHAPADEASDADLVRRAAAGERDAFGAIYQRHHAVIYRFARMMSGSTAMAEDVTQETFVTLMRDLHRYQPQRSGLTTYLCGIARNLTRSRLRRDRRFVRIELAGDNEPAASPDPAAALASSRELAQLRKIIAGLPSRYREVVVLCHLHGFSYAEVAAILEVPVGTVRSRLNRGRQMVADRLHASVHRGSRSLSDAAERCVV